MRSLALISVFAMVTGCGDDDQRQLPTQPPTGDTTGGTVDTGTDTGIEDTGEDPPPGTNSLRFEKATDSTGLPCTTTCLEVVGPGAALEVTLVYTTAEGAPIADGQLSFSTTAPETAVKLSAKNAYTTAEGKAVLGISTFSGAEGVFDITITAIDEHDVPPLTLKLQFDVELKPPLVIDFNYKGTQAIAAFEVWLYLQEGGKPLCSDVHPDAPGNPPTAVMKKNGIGLTQKVTIDNLPGLDVVGAQSWMIQVRGPDGAAATVNGCTQDVEVKTKETRQVTVDVFDLPMKFSGVYDLVTWADMYTGLQGTAGDIIGILVNLFTEPGKGALQAACKNPSGVLDQICGFLVAGNGDLKAAGIALAKLADEAFLALIQDQLGDGVFFSGQSVAELLKLMRFSSVMTLTEEPGVPDTTGAGGAMFPAGTCSETWETVSYKWTYGLNCPPGDKECGLQTVKLSDIYGFTPAANFNAGVTDTGALWIEKHIVSGFSYGVLINFIVEKKILPLLFGDGTQPGPDGGNMPKVDTYDQVVAMIFGDKWCLYYDDCCEWFVQKQPVQDFIAQIPFGGETIAMTACNAAIPAAGSTIRDQVVGLGGDLNIGTPDGGACVAGDTDGDRTVNNLGEVTKPCDWDVSIDLAGQPFTPAADWYGLHK